MPLELIADGPGHAALRSYQDRELRPEELRVRTKVSSVKHGTEFRLITAGSPDVVHPFDPELRLHDRQLRAGDVTFPQPLGDMCVGVVEEVGAAVSHFGVGETVFGYLPARETHIATEDQVRAAPPGASDWALMYLDPATFALGGVRDGNVRLGDRVAVFGLGAIGQMAVQLARLGGARWVVGVDLIERRRDAATRHGADAAIDPSDQDAGREIKVETDRNGVDVAIETSGSSSAFYDALRSLRYAGTVVSTAYYVNPMQGLFFAGEFHRNRPRIISSRANSEPNPDLGWSFSRIEAEALSLLAEGRLSAAGLIDPIVPMAEAAEAVRMAYEHPERSIKLGIQFETG
jgi:2-desacetyl-2-hydroxyethyl bacteriochlorophyllide A dehydrogenase